MIMFYTLSYVIHLSEARPMVLTIMVIIISHYLFSKKFSINTIKLYASLIPMLVVAVTAVIIVGEGGADRFYLACTLIVPLIFFQEKKWYAPLALLNIFTFVLVTFLQQIVEPFASVPMEEKFIYSGINGLAITVLIFIMLKIFKVEITGFQETISNQKKSLEIKNKEITESITYAKGIQEAILPSKQFLSQEFANGYVIYLPKDIVAGDFYWIEKMGETLYFAAADCTGHGVPGAMVSVVCHGALQQALYEHKLTTPAVILEMTSKIVSETFSKSEREVKDGMDIALCSWNMTAGLLEFAGANNPLWIISNSKDLSSSSQVITRDLNGVFLHEIKGTKKPIGNSTLEIPFQNHSILLSKGDEVFLQTDGFADQFGGEKGKKYKYNKLKDFLLKNQYTTRKTDLISEFDNWIGEIEQVDDICLVGFKY